MNRWKSDKKRSKHACGDVDNEKEKKERNVKGGEQYQAESGKTVTSNPRDTRGGRTQS